MPTAPAKPAAIAPVGRAAPAFAFELVPGAAGAVAEAVFFSVEGALIAAALEADMEDTLAIDALEFIVEDPDAPEAAVPFLPAPAELVTPLIAPAAVANPPKPE